MSDEDLKDNTKRTYPVIDEEVVSGYVTVIKEESNHKKIINEFQH